MVYQVFDTFRPSVFAVSCFASGFHAKMRYGPETESSRRERERQEREKEEKRTEEKRREKKGREEKRREERERERVPRCWRGRQNQRQLLFKCSAVTADLVCLLFVEPPPSGGGARVETKLDVAPIDTPERL